MKSPIVPAMSAVFAGVVAVSIMTAPTAHAAERNFGGKSCAQGSVYTRADATEDVTHAVFKSSGAKVTKTFPGGVAYKVTTFYSGVPVSSKALVQTLGSIRSASMNCAD